MLLKSANAPLAVLSLPVVLLKSAPAPVAVFSSAVLARSVPAPIAVFNWPVVLLLSEKKPTRRIESAGGEAQKRGLPFRRVAARVAAIRRRNDGLRCRQKPEANQREEN